jgi:hypothetical protein
MHLIPHAALLHLAVHVHWAAGRHLREGISGRGKDRRHGEHCLPRKFRHREPLSRYAHYAVNNLTHEISI